MTKISNLISEHREAALELDLKSFNFQVYRTLEDNILILDEADTEEEIIQVRDFSKKSIAACKLRFRNFVINDNHLQLKGHGWNDFNLHVRLYIEYKKLYEAALLGLMNQDIKPIVEKTNLKNPYPQIFKDHKSFQVFERMHYEFKSSGSQLANYSFVYRIMRADGFILDSFKPEAFREWLSADPFSVELNNKLKTLDRCKTATKSILYNTVKMSVD